MLLRLYFRTRTNKQKHESEAQTNPDPGKVDKIRKYCSCLKKTASLHTHLNYKAAQTYSDLKIRSFKLTPVHIWWYVVTINSKNRSNILRGVTLAISQWIVGFSTTQYPICIEMLDFSETIWNVHPLPEKKSTIHI